MLSKRAQLASEIFFQEGALRLPGHLATAMVLKTAAVASRLLSLLAVRARLISNQGLRLRSEVRRTVAYATPLSPADFELRSFCVLFMMLGGTGFGPPSCL